MLILSEVIFLVGAFLYPSDGLKHPADIINSLLLVVLAWTISAVLFRNNWVLYDDKRTIQAKTAELYRQSITDRLTGLYNRHRLDEELVRFIKMAHEGGSTLSVVMIDIDNFKRINDTYGHHMGDRVLRNVSDILVASVKEPDMVGRWGGEEFMILCPDTALEAAGHMAQTIRMRIQRESLVLGPAVTISAGIAVYQPGEGAYSVIERADDMLYLAKKNGRNTVMPQNSSEFFGNGNMTILWRSRFIDACLHACYNIFCQST